MELLSRKENFLAVYALRALEAIDRDDPAVIAALCKAVTDKSIDMQVAAIGVVGRIGSPASAAVPALVEMLHDPNLLMRMNAAEALVSIDPDRNPLVVATVRDLLQNRQFDHRASALTLLAKIGSP